MAAAMATRLALAPPWAAKAAPAVPAAPKQTCGGNENPCRHRIGLLRIAIHHVVPAGSSGLHLVQHRTDPHAISGRIRGLAEKMRGDRRGEEEEHDGGDGAKHLRRLHRDDGERHQRQRRAHRPAFEAAWTRV